MLTRRIPLHKVKTQDPKINGWLQANDVDPNHVVAASYALVIDEKILAFIGFEIDRSGKKVFNGEVQGMVKVPIVVPMKSAPEDHGL